MSLPRIRVLDVETTAMEPPEGKVIELGFCDLVKNADEWEFDLMGAELYGADSIPPETRAVHHIKLAQLAGRPAFDAARYGAQMTADGVIVAAAHNAEFEQRFLTIPVPVICTWKCALRLWPTAPAHNNGTLRYWLEDSGALFFVDHELAMPPHRAGPDAYVTACILWVMLQSTSAQQLVKWTREPALYPTCPIGKQWRGKPWAEVEDSFLQWMTNQANMESDLRWNAQHELDRRRAA